MEEVRNGTFEWKIHEIPKFQSISSPEFTLGRLKCYLYFLGRPDSCVVCSPDCTLYLRCLNKLYAFSSGYILKFCFVGVSGEFLVTKLHMTNRKFSDRIPLATIVEEEFKTNMAGGYITVRLSWYENVEQETQTTSDQISNTQGPQTMLDTLSKDFSCFFESKEDTDCVLRVGDAKFPVHRAVLSARSEVFAAMFRHDTSETRSGVVDIQDVEVGVLSDFLHYVYSGKVHGLTADTAVALYIVADKYALLELRDFCLDFLINNLKIGNVCDAAVLAHSHGEEELERKVVQFLLDKMEDVQNSDEWKNFEINKPSLAFKLLRFTVIASKDKIKETFLSNKLLNLELSLSRKVAVW